MLYDPQYETKLTTALLIAGRDLIGDPKNWCQKGYQNGSAFCAVGALVQASLVLGLSEQTTRAAFERLDSQTGGHTTRFNDSRSHTDVLAAYDRAIAA